MKNILKPSLNWLLIFVPVTVLLRYYFVDHQTLTFISACIAIIPLASIMGHATEHISCHVGQGIGGLLNATFGNAAELIIAIMALRQGLYEVVKASLTGSIIGNILLVLGAAFVAGGTRHKIQDFNIVGARSQSATLTLAAIALIIPAFFHYLAGPEGAAREHSLSRDISIVLLITYALALLFTLHTHKQLFMGEELAEEIVGTSGSKKPWSLSVSLGVLAGVTVIIAWMSEMLVSSVEHAAAAFGMSNVFVGVIVVAIVGNAAEHSTAILVALKNKMDLSLSIAIGSSVQIAIFVAPLLVLLSYVIGPHPMDLVFSPAEVLAVVLSIYIVGQITGDGKSNWFEGAQLLSVYLLLALVFYFLPASVHGH